MSDSDWRPDQKEFPCRCGDTHDGDYALYDWMHHNCFHDQGWWHLGSGQLICVDCGAVSWLDTQSEPYAPEDNLISQTQDDGHGGRSTTGEPYQPGEAGELFAGPLPPKVRPFPLASERDEPET